MVSEVASDQFGLGVVEAISHETVGVILKKTNWRKSNGVS